MLDNSTFIAPFVPEKDDGDMFIYTEMLDRGKKKGNNGQRLLKTFYHRSRDEFWEQLPTIQKLCDMAQVRACTRLAPRSYKKVGREFTRLVVDTAMSENWAGMKSLYNRACGIVSPNSKIWIFDVDVMPESDPLVESFRRDMLSLDAILRDIPSKKGRHWLARPFDMRKLPQEKWIACQREGKISLHKDNPTNLYIPDGAD